jgi:DUF4097 and DUF4098 domain-containing protein YvlB
MQRSVSSIRNKRAQESTMHTFTTPAPVTAVLDIPAGRVQLIAAGRASTTVEIRPADPASSRDIRAAEQTQASYAGGMLTIEAAPARNRILGNSGSVEVTVQLPAGSRVQATTASTEFRAVGRLGDITVDSAQATIKIDEAASARLTVQAGDITAGRLGTAQISTGKGDITITEATHGALELATQDGSITITTAPGVSAALDAGTTYGRIRNALTNTGTAPDLTIHATTTRGDITARTQ